MTTITLPDVTTGTLSAAATGLDRALLRAASALDAHVLGRVERRAGLAFRRAASAQAAADRIRRDATARAAIGILPR